MPKPQKELWSKNHQIEQSNFWPWTLLVISVGIIFFHLGKINRLSSPSATSQRVLWAAPLVTTPGNEQNLDTNFPTPKEKPPQKKPQKKNLKASLKKRPGMVKPHHVAPYQTLNRAQALR